MQEGLKKPGVKEVYGQFQDLEHNDPKWHKAGDIRWVALPAHCLHAAEGQHAEWC